MTAGVLGIMHPVGRPRGRENQLKCVTTVIFTKEIGHRMAVIRKKMLWEQKELGEKLGVHQKTISSLEGGKLTVPQKPFTVARMEAIFGNHMSYILYGSNKERYNEGLIHTRYWEFRLMKNRKEFFAK